MNKRNSTKFLLPAVLLGSVVAVAEEWHPSGFQPAPVFEDEGLVGRAAFPHKPPAKPAADVPAPSHPKPIAEKAPAAPPPAQSARAASVPEETVVSKSAGDHRPRFEPPPVFEDEGLARKAMPSHAPPAAQKPAEPPVAAAVPKPVSPAPVAARSEAGTPQAKPAPAAAAAPSSGGWTEVLATNFPLGLIVLALAGYVFWSTRRAGGAVRTGSPTPPVPPANSAKTGVARYLEGLSAETGVAKYLRKLGG
jgi:hypothetical protein